MRFWDMCRAGAVASGAALLVMSSPVAAQDQVKVPLPDISALDDEAASALAIRIGEANVITSNCPGQEISGGEWTLLVGTGDLLAEKLQMDAAEYDRNFNAPAYALLDDPGACDQAGQRVAPLIDELEAMGGATSPDMPEAASGDPAQARGGDAATEAEDGGETGAE